MGWDGHDGWRDLGGWRAIVHDDGQGNNPYTAEEIFSLMWFAQHNGAKQWLLYEAGGELRYFKGSTPAAPWTAIADFNGRTLSRTEFEQPWAGSHLMAWSRRAYITNGIDEPVCFNGDHASPIGFSNGPPAPVATAVSQVAAQGSIFKDMGLGVRSSSSKDTRVCGVTYRVSFINMRGQESPLSPVSQHVLLENSDTAKMGAWVELPIGPDGTMARRVYRSVNFLNSQGEPFSVAEAEVHHFVEEVPDNSTDYFEDWLPDTGLGSQVDELQLGAFPAAVKFMVEFKGVAFAVVDGEDGVRHSRPGFAEVFPPNNFIPLGSSQQGPITGMRATKNAIVVFRQRAIFLIKGDLRDGFYSEPLSYETGAVSHAAMTEVPGVGLFFLSERGGWILEGALENTGTPTRPIRITTPIPDEMERLNTSALVMASATVSHRRRELWISVPSLSKRKPDMALVWNYEVNAWSVDTDIPANRIIEVGDHRGHLFFASNDTARQGICVISHGWQDKGGVTIRPRFESAVFDLNSPAFNFHPRYLNVHAVTMGDNDLRIDYRVNRKVQWLRVEDSEVAYGLDQQNPDDVLQVYDTAVFGTGVWGDIRPGMLRYDISTQGQPQCREFQFELTPAQHRFHLVGFELLVDSMATQVKPLNITSHDRRY